jgi:hypothetical protein
MNSSLHPPIAPGKKLAASLCLLAVLLLWSPLWAAALEASGMACCTGAMCPAHSHPKSNHGNAANPSASEEPMQCNHSGSGSLMNCSMSCCQDQGQTFVTSVHFVLPQRLFVPSPQQSISSAPIFEVPQILRRNDPLSPPPRNPFL